MASMTFHPLESYRAILARKVEEDATLPDMTDDQVEAVLDHLWGAIAHVGSSPESAIGVTWARMSHRVNPAVGWMRMADLRGDEEGVKGAHDTFQAALLLGSAEAVASLAGHLDKAPAVDLLAATDSVDQSVQARISDKAEALRDLLDGSI